MQTTMMLVDLPWADVPVHRRTDGVRLLGLGTLYWRLEYHSSVVDCRIARVTARPWLAPDRRQRSGA